jgi:hypothetical protein
VGWQLFVRSTCLTRARDKQAGVAKNAEFDRSRMNSRNAISDVAGTSARKWVTILFRLAGILVALIGLCAIAAFTPRVARVYPVSSDDATGVLEADAVLRGNVFLSGWTLSNVSFVTTDLPFYVAGVAIAGMRPSLLRDVPVAVYMAAVAVGAALARGRIGGGRALLGMTAMLVLLCLPAGGLAEFVTKGYIRVGTTLGAFAALLALDVPVGRPIGRARLVAFAVLLTMTLLADSFALVTVVLPVLFASAFGARRDRPYGEIKLWAVSLTALASVAAARGLSALIEWFGGYRVVPFGLLDFLAYRDSLRAISRNVLALVENLPSLYRCAFPEEFTTTASFVWLGCLIGPLFLFWAFCRRAAALFPRRQPARAYPADFIGDVLWLAAMLCLAAYLASSIPKDRTTTRYMVPFVLCVAVAGGRVLAERASGFQTAVVALALLGTSYAFTVRADLRKPTAPDHAVYLADWLAGRGLRYGYAPFWGASIVTVSSGGRVAVRPIFVRAISPERHKIVPLPWMTDARWFADELATFVVIEIGQGAAYQFGVTERNCVTSFGAFKKRYDVGPYTVLVWDHDLRPQLGD